MLSEVEQWIAFAQRYHTEGDWLVFHLRACPWWKMLRGALRGKRFVSVCIDEPNLAETEVCKKELRRITGLQTTPCVFHAGAYVGDSTAAQQRLNQRPDWPVCHVQH